jgi:hypothetical protein
MDSRSIGIILIAIGIAALIAGVLALAGGLDWFGRLPGDVRIGRGNTRVYFPFATMILLSVALSLVLHFVRRFL